MPGLIRNFDRTALHRLWMYHVFVAFYYVIIVWAA